jgi:lysine-N-methylase
VDEEALEKYAFSSHHYADRVLKSIEREETPHFCLVGHDRCPHLDEQGLCKIITEMGEEYLCDICREHPRFYNDTPRGKEVGLGMACEEACRLILSTDDYADMIVVGRVAGEPYEIDFDSLSNRENIYEILLTDGLRYGEKRRKICEKYGVSLSLLTREKWRERLASLEYLEEAHRTLFQCFDPAPPVQKKNEKVLDRALAYFVYRHVTETESDEEFRAALGFCLFCDGLLASLLCLNQGAPDAVTLARIVSEELEYSTNNTEAIKSEWDATRENDESYFE